MCDGSVEDLRRAGGVWCIHAGENRNTYLFAEGAMRADFMTLLQRRFSMAAGVDSSRSTIQAASRRSFL
jgi:hypothetical protein